MWTVTTLSKTNPFDIAGNIFEKGFHDDVLAFVVFSVYEKCWGRDFVEIFFDCLGGLVLVGNEKRGRGKLSEV